MVCLYVSTSAWWPPVTILIWRLYSNNDSNNTFCCMNLPVKVNKIRLMAGYPVQQRSMTNADKAQLAHLPARSNNAPYAWSCAHHMLKAKSPPFLSTSFLRALSALHRASTPRQSSSPSSPFSTLVRQIDSESHLPSPSASQL